jgi:hypothetical protein
MTSIDVPTLINWITTGFIGLFFGVISAWVVYRYERKRDDITWEREKDKLRQQFEHEKELLASEFQLKLEEMNQQALREQGPQIRSELLRGIERPAEAIANIERTHKELEPQRAERRIRGLIRIDIDELGMILGLTTQLINYLHQLQAQTAGRIPPNMIESVVQVQHYIQQWRDMFMAADQSDL